MAEENFSPQESLEVIRTMLQKSREDVRGDDIYFLVWGWLTFICCTAQFILKHVLDYPKHYLVWWLVPVGVVLSVIISIRQGKQKKVSTYVGESMGYLWMGMGISFFVLSMIISSTGWDKNPFPFFILLYGLGTFISGCLLRFKPFIIGGILAWLIAIGSAYLEYDYQVLAGGLAIMVSYLIPAYMLRNMISKEDRKKNV